jgi:hypothetical protein
VEIVGSKGELEGGWTVNGGGRKQCERKSNGSVEMAGKQELLCVAMLDEEMAVRWREEEEEEEEQRRAESQEGGARRQKPGTRLRPVRRPRPCRPFFRPRALPGSALPGSASPRFFPQTGHDAAPAQRVIGSVAAPFPPSPVHSWELRLVGLQRAASVGRHWPRALERGRARGDIGPRATASRCRRLDAFSGARTRYEMLRWA